MIMLGRTHNRRINQMARDAVSTLLLGNTSHPMFKEVIGITPQTFKNWQAASNNGYKAVQEKTLISFAKAMGVTLEEILSNPEVNVVRNNLQQGASVVSATTYVRTQAGLHRVPVNIKLDAKQADAPVGNGVNNQIGPMVRQLNLDLFSGVRATA